MRSWPLQRVIGFGIALLAWTACGGAGSTPATQTVTQAAAVQVGDDPALRNISGQYAGTIKDSANGKGKAALDLAQYRNATGGTMTVNYGTHSGTASGAFLVSGNALRGTQVSSGCVFAESAQYDPSTHSLSGSYRALHGCDGEAEKGTFTLKQHCFYARDWTIRKDAGGLKMC
jgi:hypothetical protein